MQGKMLKMEHKSFLRKEGLNPKQFLFLKEDCESWTFLYRKTNRQVIIRR